MTDPFAHFRAELRKVHRWLWQLRNQMPIGETRSHLAAVLRRIQFRIRESQ